MMPTIIARTRIDPATAPAIAPPLMRVKLVDEGDGEAASLASEGATSDVGLDDGLEDAI